MYHADFQTGDTRTTQDAIEKGVCLAGRLLANTPRQMQTAHVAWQAPTLQLSRILQFSAHT